MNPQPVSAAPQLDAGGGGAPRPRRSRRRLWLFRALTLLLAAAAVAGCEVGLRLIGFGESYDLAVPVEGRPLTLATRLNPDIDRVYFGSRDMMGPEPRRFALPRPPDTYRIIVLGESTVIGFPYAPEIAFPRQIELLLEAQRPALDVEVLNAGITAINSFEIADLAARCAACQPDLVIIHCGHNEFFGPGGPGSTVLPLPPRLIDAAFAIRRTRIGQAMAKLLPASAPAAKHPLEAFPRLTDIRIDDPEFAQAATNFRKNLTAAVASLREAGVPVMLSTVACNLRDQGPIRNVWPRALPQEDRKSCEQLIRRAVRLAESDVEAALDVLAQAEEISPQAALLQYRKGQLLLQNGDAETAAEAFSLARDYDGCRFRAPRRFGEIVRELAKAANDPGVRLLDTESIVAASSADGVPGRDLFLEHVHYNLSGHRLLAREFSRFILTEILDGDWEEIRDLRDETLDQQLGLMREDELVGASFALEAVQTPPLSEAVDPGLAEKHLSRLIGELYDSLPARRRDRFADLSMRELQQELIPALAGSAARERDFEESVRLARLGVKRQAWSPRAWLLLAQALAQAGEDAEAADACRHVLQLEPLSAEARELREAVGDGS